MNKESVFRFSATSLRWIYGKEIRFFNQGSRRELNTNARRHLVPAMSHHLSSGSGVELVTTILGELRRSSLMLCSVFCGSDEEHWLRMGTFLRLFELTWLSKINSLGKYYQYQTWFGVLFGSVAILFKIYCRLFPATELLLLGR